MPVKPTRFEDRIEPVPEAGCWIWTGALYQKSGYGQYHCLTKRRSVGAHREAWRRAFGEIPVGLYVCHRCDVPSCVNPAHLFLGTAADNARDMQRKGRKADTSGERPNVSKITAEQARMVRSLVGRMRPGQMQALSAQLGISRGQIRRIRIGERWRNA